MKRLLLIDGHAILHRAFHALPPLTTSNGTPVNAVYGFVRMLLKVIDDLKPTHLAVCFDRPEPTFREKIFAGYQAQRPKMEEELVSQVDLVKKVVRTMKIPIYEKAGYEADDIIGSLAVQAAEVAHENLRDPLLARDKTQVVHHLIGAVSEAISANFVGSPPPACPPVFETIIVTGDKDILQLVNEKTKVYMLIKGLSMAKLFGAKEVKEKYGIEPKQMVDYKALVGDPSDNYPGVKGVGPRTAAELLKCFGTLERIYDKINSFQSLFRKDEKTHVHQFVNERVFKALKQDKERADLAKKLAKIVTDAPVKLDLEKARLGKLDKPEVRKLFSRLEFKSLIPRLENKADGKEVTLRTQNKIENAERNKQLSLI